MVTLQYNYQTTDINVNQFMINLIADLFGNRLKNRFGADWGGVDVWHIKNDMYVLITECNEILVITRNEDIDDSQIFISDLYYNCENYDFTDVYNYLKSLK